MTPFHITQLIEPWLQRFSVSPWWAQSIANLVGLCALVLFYLFARRLALPTLQKGMAKFAPKQMERLAGSLNKLTARMAGLFTCVMFLAFDQRFLVAPEWVLSLTTMLIQFFLIVFSGLLVSALINLGHDIYRQWQYAQDIPIQGFIQVGKLITFIVCTILCVSLLLDKSPAVILSGFGAIAAVVLLVFKDTILGLVASIQIAANRLVSIGDWIQVDAFGADGEVLDLGLNTVRVRNWDNTITTIPTYLLISDSFKNWRAMQESAGRRIKRAIYIDLESVHSVTVEDAQTLAAQYGFEISSESTLTNVQVFRQYAEHYLRTHPDINQACTLMVRALAPNELGLGLEVYCFSRNTQWVPYEHLQAQIIEHLVVMLNAFELRPYQALMVPKQGLKS